VDFDPKGNYMPAIFAFSTLDNYWHCSNYPFLPEMDDQTLMQYAAHSAKALGEDYTPPQFTSQQGLLMLADKCETLSSLYRQLAIPGVSIYPYLFVHDESDHPEWIIAEDTQGHSILIDPNPMHGHANEMWDMTNRRFLSLDKILQFSAI